MIFLAPLNRRLNQIDLIDANPWGRMIIWLAVDGGITGYITC